MLAKQLDSLGNPGLALLERSLGPLGILLHRLMNSILHLLQTGVARDAPQGASTMGPMAEVVFGSTQYLSAADLDAMAVYLKALPPVAAPPTSRVRGSDMTDKQPEALES